MTPPSLDLRMEPLSPERWDDLERLFGPQGAYSGCWCMWWRLRRSEFERNGNAGNKKALRSLVRQRVVPGLLAYDRSEPVAWCSVAPREEFGSLNRSRVLKPIDDALVWSLVCFFVKRSHRGRGALEQLIGGAAEWARRHGGSILEVYPSRPRGDRLGPLSSFMGVPEVFRRLGFVEVARPSKAKLVMRRQLALGESSSTKKKG